MKKQKKEPLAFRVLQEDRGEVIEAVHKLLKEKGYRLYEKQNSKTRKKGKV